MEEERVTRTDGDGRPVETHTTVIDRGGGSGGGLLIGLAVLILVIVGAFYLYNRSQNDNARTNAVTKAADDVGAGAKKVGDSAQKAADSATN